MAAQSRSALPTTRSALENLPQDAMKDSAVAVVFDLDGGIDAAGGGERDSLPVLTGGGDGDFLAGLEGIGELNVEGFSAGEAKSLASLAFLINQREHTHADQIRAVNSLKTLGHCGLDAKKL